MSYNEYSGRAIIMRSLPHAVVFACEDAARLTDTDVSDWYMDRIVEAFDPGHTIRIEYMGECADREVTAFEFTATVGTFVEYHPNSLKAVMFAQSYTERAAYAVRSWATCLSPSEAAEARTRNIRNPHMPNSVIAHSIMRDYQPRDYDYDDLISQVAAYRRNPS